MQSKLRTVLFRNNKILLFAKSALTLKTYLILVSPSQADNQIFV